MMRLVRHGLMFGNLIAVSSPALVKRYNRALEHLTGKTTALTEFHIDISGFSPEIGNEFGDDLYLNPKGYNQQFILLTTDQKKAPLLNMRFSGTRDILQNFITMNEDELFILTTRDAVAGELLNSVFDVTHPKQILDIRQITIEADTISEHVAGAQAMQDYIERFMSEDDAWWDDVLIADMIELAKQTGNIQRHPVQLNTPTFSQDNFYTRHFGGIYVFRDVPTPTIIAHRHVEGLEEMGVENILTFENRDEIARFLRLSELAEPIVRRRHAGTIAIIEQKIDFITIATAAEAGDDLGDMTRQNIRHMRRKYADHMPPELEGLMRVWRWADMNGPRPDLAADHPSYFYALRSTQHEHRHLVNMLLSDLSPLDFRQLFICHKEAFYEAYRDWSDAKRDYVVKFLSEEYAMDKDGAREALFGDEPRMDANDISPVKASDSRKKSEHKSRHKHDRNRRDDDDDDDEDGGEDWDERESHRKMRSDYRKRRQTRDKRRNKKSDQNHDQDKNRRRKSGKSSKNSYISPWGRD